MRRFVLFVLALMALLTGCTEKSANYKYADNWTLSEVETEIQHYRPGEDLYRYSTKIEGVDLSPIKQIITEYFKGNDELDWENFDQVSSIRTVNVASIDEIQELPVELLQIIVGYQAMYDDDSKAMYLFPAFYEAQSEMQTHALAHELIHALMSTGHENYSRLEEGAVDYYTARVLEAAELQNTPVYVGEILAVTWLMDVYGEQEIVKATCDGRLNELVDEATKPGMADKLSQALIIVHTSSGNTTQLTEAANVEYDILSHVAVSRGRCDAVKNRLLMANLVYASAGINLNLNYFNELLRG